MKLLSPLHWRTTQKLDGIAGDSGQQGTPELLGKCMQKLDMTSNCLSIDSCGLHGLHDLQSVLRYPILNCIKANGLDSSDAIQLLHLMYAFLY